MKRFLWFLMTGAVIVVLLAGGIAAAAFADSPTATGYSNVSLWVNPEYDEPQLLVMMQGTITGATPPATVEFLVPSTAVMYSAGAIDSNGNYSGGPPNRVPSQYAGWDLISYNITTSNTFRVEYYNDIIKGSPDKTIDYQFMTPLPITNLTVAVQQPKTATNFKVDPAGNPSTDSQGFNIQTYSYATVAPTDTLNFTISYTKTDNNPSLTQTPAASSGGNSGGLSNGLIILIVVVVVVAGIGAYYFISRQSRPVSRNERRRRAGVPRRSAVGSRNTGGGGARASGGSQRQQSGGGNARPAQTSGGGRGKFCSNCGTPFEDDAKFCRQCGAPRR